LKKFANKQRHERAQKRKEEKRKANASMDTDNSDKDDEDEEKDEGDDSDDDERNQSSSQERSKDSRSHAKSTKPGITHPIEGYSIKRFPMMVDLSGDVSSILFEFYYKLNLLEI
jgi:hypothetical protein